MIPTIEQIVEDLAAGTITKEQAVAWLHQHAAGAFEEDRKTYAALAMQGLIASGITTLSTTASLAVAHADNLIDELNR